MICYKDRSYCANKTHKPNCNRQITDKEKKHAKKLGLPISFGNFCGEDNHELLDGEVRE